LTAPVKRLTAADKRGEFQGCERHVERLPMWRATSVHTVRRASASSLPEL
jgi:hypothetical protein